MSLDLSRHRGATLVAATVVVVVVVAVVVAVGLQPYPDLPRLADQPEPVVTAQIAVRVYERDGPCLRVVDGRGRATDLGCGPTFEGGGLRWIDDHLVAVDGFRFVPVDEPDLPDPVTVVDVRTGEVSTVEAPIDDGVPDHDDQSVRDGVRLRVGGLDGEVWVDVVDGTDTTRALTLDGPDGYVLHQPMWAADGRWFTVDDSAGRTIVVAVPGVGPDDAPARIWLDTDGGEHVVR